jgi:hypothetical protein
MSDSVQWLREQAERCLRLARVCADTAIAESLKALAAEYFDRATKLEAEQPIVQQQQQIQPKKDE